MNSSCFFKPRFTSGTVLLVLTVLLFSACSRTPDHMRYIPKDAVVVAGVNAKALGKKIAWNVITGSKLFKEMQKRLPEKNAKDAISGIEKAGIDVMNTFYVYIKTDTRLKGGNRVTGLVPLADVGQWEAYVKRVFPQAEIKQHGDRKEASLGRDLYVGWNKNLLIGINVMQAGGDGEGQDAGISSAMGSADISAEMDNAFGVTKENSIVGNANFQTLEQEGHDVTFWLNYEQLMLQYSGNMAEKVGVSLSGVLWKDAAITSGFDFVKGKITGDMRYYVSGEIKEIGKELSSANADKDMLDRLQHEQLDMLVAFHISPKGVKSMLEKTGLLGIANTGLNSGGMSVDNILDALTGDMAFVMNDFKLSVETETDSFMGQKVTHKNQKSSLSMCYVLKINKKEQFQKFVKMAKDNGLQESGNGFVLPLTSKDTVYILMNDQYVAASNKRANAVGFLEGSFKSQKVSDAVAPVMAHPLALYIDIDKMFNNVDPAISNTAQDSIMITESKKLLSSFSISGGDFKNNAFEYHMDLSFKNTEENSILQLMDYGMKLSEADKVANK